MRVKNIYKLSIWTFSLVLLAVMFFLPINGTMYPVGNGAAWAQTGAPPAPTPVTNVDNSHPRIQPPVVSPGVSVVQVVKVPALPERVAPITDKLSSTIVRVPIDNRPTVIGVVDFLLNDGSLAALNVPGKTDTEQIVRVAELPAKKLPAPVPDYAEPSVAYVFEVDVFNCAQDCNAVGDAVHQHNPPLQLLIQPPEKSDPSTLALLHFNSESNAYQVVLGTMSPDGYMQFPLVQTSKFVLTQINDWDKAQPSILYPVVVPAGLPRTGDGSHQMRDPMSYNIFVLLGLAIVAFGFFLWRRKRIHP